MARVFPENIESYKPTASELFVYQELKRQLPERCLVFYSIRWFTAGRENEERKMSEADFLIFDPQYGYLVLEVKGGHGIRVEGDQWFLDEGDSERKLRQSPYEQAENSMRYFLKYYEEQYNYRFGGIYGAAVVYPFYKVNNPELLSNRPKEETLDAGDMGSLEERIRDVFRIWAGKKLHDVHFTPVQKEQFIQLVHKRIAVSAAAGALIQYKREQLELINRVQDNYLHLLENYPKFCMRGGAGTGKTWIAIKAARKYREEGQKVLFLCAGEPLCRMIRQQEEMDGITVMTFQELMKNVLGTAYDRLDPVTLAGVLDLVDERRIARYDVILVDEAQDFTDEWALVTVMFLRDPQRSRLLIFCDETQNVHSRDFGRAFLFDYPDFILRENLRNTSNIYKWAVQHTGYGGDVIVNPIAGPVPEKYSVRDPKSAVMRVEAVLDELIHRENVKPSSIVILTAELVEESCLADRRIAGWRLSGNPAGPDEIRLDTAIEFKGLEADVVIYLHRSGSSKTLDYVAYTRARFYLYEVVY